MNFLGKYSNSMGHLIMSVVSMAVGLVLVLVSQDGTLHGIGVSLILTASGFWFGSSVARNQNTPPTNGGGTTTP